MLLKSVLTYLRAELPLSTVAVVTGMITKGFSIVQMLEKARGNCHTQNIGKHCVA